MAPHETGIPALFAAFCCIHNRDESSFLRPVAGSPVARQHPFGSGMSPIQQVMSTPCLSAAGVRLLQLPIPAEGLALPCGRVTGKQARPQRGSLFRIPEKRSGQVPSVRRSLWCARRALPFPFHVRLITITTVSATTSTASHDDASGEGSRSSTWSIFASPWVGWWVSSPLGFSPQLHTLPLPAAHVGLATGLHTGRDSFGESL